MILSLKMDVILVVIYNQNVFESQTLKSLLKLKKIVSEKHLFVWDNSFNNLNENDLNLLKNHFFNFDYHHSPENTSLSIVYNKVIKNLIFNKIFIFDQDTTIESNYFSKMEDAAIANEDIGLFIPIVKYKDRILSPLSYKVLNFNRNYPINLGRNLSKNRTAFASGLCVKEWVFKKNNIWFDENLQFYGIDYKFVLDYGDSLKYIFIIDYELSHELSFTEKEDKTIKIKRFNSGIYSGLYLAKTRLNFFKKIIFIIRVFFSALRLTLLFKDVIFLKILLRHFHTLFIK